MVSFKNLFAAGALLLTTAVSALPTGDVAIVSRAEEYTCGTEPSAGIRKPANGSTITFTAAEQNNYDGHTFEIIYCSSQYFKTASLNVSTWLSNYATSNGPASSTPYSAEALSLGNTPDSSVAPAGYYGYKYNVTVYPISGNYPSGLRTLTVYEVETGYYNANNIETHSIVLNFTKKATS